MTDEIFKHLLELEKQFEDRCVELPQRGKKKVFSVISCCQNEKFFIDTDRKGKIELSKSKLQNRHVASKEPLIRIEIDCPPHTNPDGESTSRNHIHVFKEGYDLSWAFDLDDFHDVLFKNIHEFNQVFVDFCALCNIQLEKPTEIQSVI